MPPIFPLARAGSVARTLATYFGGYGGAQLLGMASGLILVNVLPINEYALFTLASSLIGFLTFGADFGSSNALLYFFRRSSELAEDFGSYVAAAMRLRRGLLLLWTVVLAVLALEPSWRGELDGASVAAALVIAFLSVWLQVDASVGILVLRLRGRERRAYLADLASSAVRFGGALVIATLCCRRGLAALALAAGGSALARLVASPGLGLSQGEAPRTAVAPRVSQLLRYLLPTLPSGLFFALQGPLFIWLTMVFGSVRNVAEIGALGRLGLIIGLFGGLSGVVFLPRLASTVGEGAYWRRFNEFLVFEVVLACGIVGFGFLAPDSLLRLLGSQYAGLRSELVLVLLVGALSLVGAYVQAVNHARSWTRLQWLLALGQLSVQAVGILLGDLSTTAGVLKVQVASAFAALLLQGTVLVAGRMGSPRVVWHA